MKKIDRYITINFIKSVALSLFGFINIFILSQMFKIIRYVTEGKFSGFGIVVYIMALLPDIIIKVAPLAILLGGLITVNKMASNLEIIALKTSGISFKRIVIFPVILSFLVSLVVYYMYDIVYPKAVYNYRNMRRGSIREIELPKSKVDAFLRGNGDYVYRAKLIDRENNRADYMQIVDLDSKFENIERIINAKSGEYDRANSNWILKDVVINYVKEERIESREVYIDKEFTEEPELFLAPKIEIKEMTVQEMKDALTIIKRTGGNSTELLAAIAERRSFPFASFVVSFLGLALGSRYVRGTSALSIVTSVFLGYGYYVLQASLKAVSLGGVIHPFIALWLPNVLFFGIGIYAMYRAEY